MSHLETQQAIARTKARRKYARKGVADIVRAQLDKGPATVDEIAQRTGLPRHQVCSSVSCMLRTTGGVMTLKKKRGATVYARTAYIIRQEQRTDGVNIAGRIVIGRGSKWGAGLA